MCVEVSYSELHQCHFLETVKILQIMDDVELPKIVYI